MADVKTHLSSQSESKEGMMTEIHPLPPLLQGLSPEEIKVLEKKLLRKVDIRLMPTLIIIYIMNYLDRYVSKKIIRPKSNIILVPMLTM